MTRYRDFNRDMAQARRWVTSQPDVMAAIDTEAADMAARYDQPGNYHEREELWRDNLLRERVGACVSAYAGLGLEIPKPDAQK